MSPIVQVNFFYLGSMSNHQELSDFIKSVHIDLRLRSRKVGATAAWDEHCTNKEKLEKYASAMKELASIHWEKNNGETSQLSRIFWVMKQIEWYFNGDGKRCFLEKEKKLVQKFSLTYDTEMSTASEEPLCLLDVGSCYNPFSKFSNLKVTAVDLAPANEQVLKCDFLSVPVGDRIILEEMLCKQLPKEYFDVVVFSLLLEYLPSPEQRFVCCSKASSLLKKGGILLILTPDSKHASANSKLLKQWRFALATVGFLLLQTEKLKHLRCLLFAKTSDLTITMKWLSVQKITLPPEEAIAIPQDKNQYDNIGNNKKGEQMRDEIDNKFVADSFSCLIAEDDIFI